MQDHEEPSAGAQKLRKRYLRVLALIPLLGLAVAVSLIFLPLELMRIAIPPADRLAGGPVSGGNLFFLPPMAFAMYVFWAAASKRRAQLANFDETDTLSRFAKSTLGSPRAIVFLALLGVVYASGFFSYWYATPRALTVRESLFSGAKDYAWGSVLARHISCRLSRSHSVAMEFIVDLPDGRSIDLADTQQQDVVEHFEALAELTRRARTVTSEAQLRACPPSIEQLVRQQILDGKRQG